MESVIKASDDIPSRHLDEMVGDGDGGSVQWVAVRVRICLILTFSMLSRKVDFQAWNVLTGCSTDLTIHLLLGEMGLDVVLHVIFPPHGLLTGVTLVHHHRPQLVSYFGHIVVKCSWK